MVRCKWSHVLKFIVLVTFVVCVSFWWNFYHPHMPKKIGSEKIQENIILNQENAPFLNLNSERRFNPKIIFGKSDFDEFRRNNTNQDDIALNEHKSKTHEDDIMDIESNSVNYNVHAFYYAWYGSPGQDGRYFHWNHQYLPHWDKKLSAKFPTGQAHVPPDDIAASYYPLLGPYSSVDESVTRAHMMQMQQAGIGVLSLSWYPPGQADEHGKPVESYIPTIFNIADQYTLKVCFHIEPYPDRSPSTIRNDLRYIFEKYGDHPAFYRYRKHPSSEALPLVYIYDSYLIPPVEWKNLLMKSGDISVRGSELDAVFIGLLVEKKHISLLSESGFDGMYTYFAADRFSYGSDREHWHGTALLAKRNNLMFIPSVGPGYDDLKVRPWNGENSRKRDKGSYYEYGWKKAISTPNVDIISITSFNEWHEGSQIEPASSESKHGKYTYLTYDPHNPEYYLQMTKKWSVKFEKSKETDV